jgi:proton-dependent oligopeptide transporter, POT family
VSSALAARIRTTVTGFHPTFWVANGMELFERLAFYGQQIVIAIFLRNKLGFTEEQAGGLTGIFGGLIYLLPIVGGTLADKFGFRRAFAFAFGILAVGYLLIGTTGMSALEGFYRGLPLYPVLLVYLIFTAIGGSFIKPSVLGTVAVTSTPENKSMGYAIYYWIVNVGALLGPTIAFLVRDSAGIEFVYVVSSVSCAAMFIVNAFFYKEVKREGEEHAEPLSTKMKNLVTVLSNGRFMIFLLIFSLYWITFWQEFIIMPYYIVDFIDPNAPFEIIQSWAGAGAIILLQIPVNLVTKHLHTRTAILVGFAVSGLCWMIVALTPSVPTIVAGVMVFAIGEMTQAPRYYEYISELAPRGQQGMYQGYAFLPIAIAFFVGGPFGGHIYATYAKGASDPSQVWWIVFGVGMLATILMAFYNLFITPKEAAGKGM